MTRKVTIRLRDEVNCSVIGLHGSHTEQLYNKFSAFVAGYFYQPLYKLGRWDGKIRYYRMDNSTYVYLLDRIIPYLVGWGYELVLEDLRQGRAVHPDLIDENLFAHINHVDTGEPTILRPHQVRVINALLENGHGTAIAATGAGKTIICAALCHVYGQFNIRSITIVPSADLVKQTKADYITYMGEELIGEYSGTLKDPDKQHVITTWQALKNAPHLIKTFGMVIVDECHGLRGKQLTSLLTEHASQIPHRFGVTGTLPKEESDQMAVVLAVGDPVVEVNAAELIDKGVLSRLKIQAIQLEENLKPEYDEYRKSVEDAGLGKPMTYIEYKEGYFPDFAAEKRYLQRHKPRVQWIADEIIARSQDRQGNVLCLVDSIAMGRALTSLVEGSVFINGQDVKQKDRKDTYDMFAERDDLIVFATVHVAGTGLSINRIYNLFLVDVGKSFTRVIQAIGRGLRRASDKNFVNVFDIGSDLKYGKRHATERINYYKEAQYPHERRKILYEDR